MGPGMHGDIALVGLEGKIELRRIIDDVHPNEEVGRPDLILSKKCVEAIGQLYNT